MIDLHIHTTVSDGTLTPSQAAARAAELGLSVIALADHDVTDGIEPAAAAAEPLNLEVVPAIEINTDYAETEIHLLGYFIDPQYPALQALLQQIRDGRCERTRNILRRLEELGVPLLEERVLQISGAGSVCRPHIAAAMVEAGHVGSIIEAFDRYLGRGKPAYIPRISITPQQAIEAIHAAGGISVIAHPLKIRDQGLVERMIAAGAMGIEAFHCDHTPAEQRRYIAMASSRGLVVTGGSDSHGPFGPRPVEIGSVPVPEWVWPMLLEARARLRR